jgi:hypothetical protein
MSEWVVAMICVRREASLSKSASFVEQIAAGYRSRAQEAHSPNPTSEPWFVSCETFLFCG